MTASIPPASTPLTPTSTSTPQPAAVKQEDLQIALNKIGQNGTTFTADNVKEVEVPSPDGTSTLKCLELSVKVKLTPTSKEITLSVFIGNQEAITQLRNNNPTEHAVNDLFKRMAPVLKHMAEYSDKKVAGNQYIESFSYNPTSQSLMINGKNYDFNPISLKLNDEFLTRNGWDTTKLSTEHPDYKHAKNEFESIDKELKATQNGLNQLKMKADNSAFSYKNNIEKLEAKAQELVTKKNNAQNQMDKIETDIAMLTIIKKLSGLGLQFAEGTQSKIQGSRENIISAQNLTNETEKLDAIHAMDGNAVMAPSSFQALDQSVTSAVNFSQISEKTLQETSLSDLKGSDNDFFAKMNTLFSKLNQEQLTQLLTAQKSPEDVKVLTDIFNKLDYKNIPVKNIIAMAKTDHFQTTQTINITSISTSPPASGNATTTVAPSNTQPTADEINLLRDLLNALDKPSLLGKPNPLNQLKLNLGHSQNEILVAVKATRNPQLTPNASKFVDKLNPPPPRSLFQFITPPISTAPQQAPPSNASAPTSRSNSTDSIELGEVNQMRPRENTLRTFGNSNIQSYISNISEPITEQTKEAFINLLRKQPVEDISNINWDQPMLNLVTKLLEGRSSTDDQLKVRVNLIINTARSQGLDPGELSLTQG